MPAVAYPSPGGMSFLQLTDLVSGIAAKARIGGFAMVEFVAKKDLNGNRRPDSRAHCHARAAPHRPPDQDVSETLPGFPADWDFSPSAGPLARLPCCTKSWLKNGSGSPRGSFLRP